MIKSQNAMKNVFAITLMLFIFSCAAPVKSLRPPASNVIDLTRQNDDEEYELIVLDPGFDNWFMTTWNVGKDRSVNYYQNWNRQYVTAWNYRASNPHTSAYFDTLINYDPSIDYGIDLERKLYYYFRFVDTKKGIPILDSPAPRAI